MPISVTPLEPRDRPGIEATLKSDATFRKDEIAVALELCDEALARPDGDYEIRVARDGGDVAGYVCFGLTPMTACTYDLYWVVTHAAYRGRGVAKQLIRAMEAEISARGPARVRVETSATEGYGAARHLYLSLGYPEAVRLAEFYKPGDDLIIYYKQL
ncbi:MAG TPA: GNAT family N-acetyltransferase [Kofleriaceae bacterium]|nr:GNAT family N-acetyltransferase [Kofleriaceae bacterium]